jgi:D-3-phosphoglycerate dehydrogenase
LIDKERNLVSPIRIAVADGAIANLSWITPTADALGCELVFGPVNSQEEVATLTEGCQALIIGLQKINREKIAAFAPTITCIGRLGIGLDNIDLEAATEAKVTVIYQPLYAIEEVSNHALAMILALHRGLPAADRIIREKHWGSATQIGEVHSLQDSSVGVVGCGRIGKAVIAKLQPFVKRVIGFDVAVPAQIKGAEMVSKLDDLLSQSSIVTLHAPYLPSTHHLLGTKQIAQMQRGSILVNVSRGGLIDEDALAIALNEGQLSAAGLDVFESEPLAPESPLRSAPNLLMSPHVAWYSQSAGPRMVEWTARDVFGYLTSKRISHGNFASGSF